MTNLPELGIVIYAFLLNFVWEMLQVPFYAGVGQMPHWDGVKMCLEATVGDVGFALVAYWATSFAARSRYWFVEPSVSQMALFIAVGMALTIGFEYYYMNVGLRWTYSGLMPVVPILNIGAGPLLQWLVIPPLVVWFTRRQSGDIS